MKNSPEKIGAAGRGPKADRCYTHRPLHAFTTLINSLSMLGHACDACVDMGFAEPSGTMIVANLTRLAPWTASAA